MYNRGWIYIHVLPAWFCLAAVHVDNAMPQWRLVSQQSCREVCAIPRKIVCNCPLHPLNCVRIPACRGKRLVREYWSTAVRYLGTQGLCSRNVRITRERRHQPCWYWEYIELWWQIVHSLLIGTPCCRF